MGITVTVNGADTTCAALSDATVRVGRTTVRDKGRASSAAFTLEHTARPAGGFPAPFDPVAVSLRETPGGRL